MQDGHKRTISTTTGFPTAQKTANDREYWVDQWDLTFISASSGLHFSPGVEGSPSLRTSPSSKICQLNGSVAVAVLLDSTSCKHSRRGLQARLDFSPTIFLRTNKEQKRLDVMPRQAGARKPKANKTIDVEGQQSEVSAAASTSMQPIVSSSWALSDLEIVECREVRKKLAEIRDRYAARYFT